jgi:hypothetical protein
MGGGEQGNPALDQIQQQQQYAQLGKTLTQSLQGIGSSVANANSGLSGQVAGVGQQQGYGQPQQRMGRRYGATGQLFSQPGGMGGINEQQLAQILKALGYGG